MTDNVKSFVHDQPKKAQGQDKPYDQKKKKLIKLNKVNHREKIHVGSKARIS